MGKISGKSFLLIEIRSISILDKLTVFFLLVFGLPLPVLRGQ